jgi:biopolymer transport protein ExbB/TolQ
MAIGCPRCGSQNIVQRRHTSSAGYALLAGGIVAAFFTCGLGLVLCVIAFFLNETRGHCEECEWVWRC